MLGYLDDEARAAVRFILRKKISCDLYSRENGTSFTAITDRRYITGSIKALKETQPVLMKTNIFASVRLR